MKIKEFFLKIKEFILNFNMIMVAYVAFVTRLVIYGANMGDAIAVLSLSALYGLDKYIKSRQQPPINTQMIREIENIKAAITTLKLEKTVRRTDGKQKRYF